MRLEDTSVMRLRFTVPQTDISKITLGQTIKINVDAYPRPSLTARSPPSSQRSTIRAAWIQVQADIPNNDGQPVPACSPAPASYCPR